MKKKKEPKKTLTGVEKIREELFNIEGVEKAVITTDEGKIISSGDASGDESFAQGSACRMAAEEGISFDLGDEPPDGIIIASTSKRTTVLRVKSDILLAVLAKSEAHQQLISTEMKRAAKAIEELVKERRKKWK